MRTRAVIAHNAVQTFHVTRSMVFRAWAGAGFAVEGFAEAPTITAQIARRAGYVDIVWAAHARSTTAYVFMNAVGASSRARAVEAALQQSACH
jgi:hypothetical protein